MITVVGSANMDLVARVPALPGPGQTVLGTSLTRSPGGKGANQAVAAARAGCEVFFIGRVGSDSHGQELLESLRQAGVNTSRTALDRSIPSGTALIAVDDAGENSIVVVPGANGHVSAADVDGSRDVISASSVIVLQLEIPLETVAHAARLGREEGTLVLLNPAPAQPLEPSLTHLVDVLVANESEVAALSGMGSPFDPASAARMLVDSGTGAVIVTLGSQGAVLVTADEEIDVPAFAVDAVDTTGAGDAFVGNLARALDQKQPLESAVRFASAAAALSVQHQGAQPSMPSLQETEQLLGGETRS